MPDTRSLIRKIKQTNATITFIDEMEGLLSRVEPAGWIRQGTPQCMSSGMVVTHVRGPDGHTIEFMQPPAPRVATPTSSRRFP